MTRRQDVLWEPGPPTDKDHYETREEALVAALLDSDSGDSVTVHRPKCAVEIYLPCDCVPEVIVVGGGSA